MSNTRSDTPFCEKLKAKLEGGCNDKTENAKADVLKGTGAELPTR
eukprot:CAMPEP_0168395708 /NCGR_PEP_ID=MMETSP0228-20121227/20183_1 /TAXON_ID=133427 /ORGANISM="Protoceratium reticulatum, Strain CCCM 535 (=CCMP 1889)" /LENGTH=44 /DNA_ID= /DNA_START= /DNA_END= /DNA_ORIENTATION=